MKIDLVMWTFNSAGTLEQSLASIAKAIPEDRVCHRIIVDGGSRDGTEDIARRSGWEFFHSAKGIYRQANYALSKVDTPLYASFEHDILLSPTWLPRMERIIAKPDVAVAQGVRLARGSKPVEAMNRWMYENHTISLSTISTDNCLCRTQVIREIGGYPTPKDNLTWPDGLLWNNVFSNGYKWVVDPECISGHLRPSYWAHLKHEMGFARRRIWEYTDERGPKSYARLFFSPIRGAKIAGRYHAPSTFLAYPVFRYLVFLSALGAKRELRNRGQFGSGPDG